MHGQYGRSSTTFLVTLSVVLAKTAAAFLRAGLETLTLFNVGRGAVNDFSRSSHFYIAFSVPRVKSLSRRLMLTRTASRFFGMTTVNAEGTACLERVCAPVGNQSKAIQVRAQMTSYTRIHTPRGMQATCTPLRHGPRKAPEFAHLRGDNQ